MISAPLIPRRVGLAAIAGIGLAIASISCGSSSPSATPTPRARVAPIAEATAASGKASAPAQTTAATFKPPTTMQLGIADGLGGAASQKARAPFAYRYQYLAGGVNTPGGAWYTWKPDGDFVSQYVAESVSNKMVPVFTYYMIRQSAPNAKEADDKADFDNLQDATVMAAYWQDVKRFFQHAGQTKDTVVLHVEPDLWGFMERKAQNDDAKTVAAKVGSIAMPELSGLPDDLTGVAAAFVKLRDAYAPNVQLAYHLSLWGAGEDVVYTKPADTRLDALAQKTSRFYKSLNANFDLVFTDASDRDAAFKQYQYKDNGKSWWQPDDYTRNVRFLKDFSQATGKRIVIWQIPFGNTVMRAVNNSYNHYQDNHVETLLDPSHTVLQRYADAGVVALLFGRGADGATCACDAAKDGTTNPDPINNNDRISLSADDDGGLFTAMAGDYYKAGPLAITASP